MLLQAGGFRYAVCLQHFATMFWKMISSDSMINVFQEVETTNHVIQLFYIYIDIKPKNEIQSLAAERFNYLTSQ